MHKFNARDLMHRFNALFNAQDYSEGLKQEELGVPSTLEINSSLLSKRLTSLSLGIMGAQFIAPPLNPSIRQCCEFEGGHNWSPPRRASLSDSCTRVWCRFFHSWLVGPFLRLLTRQLSNSLALSSERRISATFVLSLPRGSRISALR